MILEFLKWESGLAFRSSGCDGCCAATYVSISLEERVKNDKTSASAFKAESPAYSRSRGFFAELHNFPAHMHFRAVPAGNVGHDNDKRELKASAPI